MKLIILDRDGVINEDSDNYIKSADEWLPIPGSIEAIVRLNKAGYTIAVATNQAGIARGLFSHFALDAMHEKMLRLVKDAGGKIETIVYCPHHPDDYCNCRKPQPGLIHQIEKILDTPAKGAWFVGDSLKDLQAAKTCECKPALVLTGKGKSTFLSLGDHESLQPVSVYSSLKKFTDQLLQEN